jgi:FkbH-like protein
VKLIEALKLSFQGARREEEVYPLFLACSFSPLHLETFTAAYLAQALPARSIVVSHGIFGDLAHNVQMAVDQRAQSVLVALEWFDFDPRLSIRSLGGWAESDRILESAEHASLRLKNCLSLFDTAQIVISFPTLPLPPLFQAQSHLLGAAESRLRQLVSDMANWAATQDRVRVIRPDALAELSPLVHRWDIKMDLAAGFPYSLGHADALAAMAVDALLPATRRKGIITDLDDTLWNGIVGDVGPENVTWSLEHGTQVHGLYQQALAALAETGTLVAVASRNEPAVVTKALERTDLVLPKEKLFPVEVHWEAKSESVARILRAWNIGASSVVFIDDSPLELAEVQLAFPEIDCRLFPKDDPAAVLGLLRWLRDEFGCESTSEEDKLRRQSLEQAQVFEAEASKADAEAFLQSLKATITIQEVNRANPRAFELVNKTNQFNVNGSRYGLEQWQALGERPDDFVLTVSYEDRFGPLGTIAVMAGYVGEREVHLEDWVVSCRAFSRRIEYRCLWSLFDRFNKDAVSIAYRPTPRNGPAQHLLQVFLKDLRAETGAELVLTRDQFERSCPLLYAEIHEPDRPNRAAAQGLLSGSVPAAK